MKTILVDKKGTTFFVDLTETDKNKISKRARNYKSRILFNRDRSKYQDLSNVISTNHKKAKIGEQYTAAVHNKFLVRAPQEKIRTGVFPI
jgi:hypothetical protein